MVENHIVEVGENIVFMFPAEAWQRDPDTDAARCC